MLLEFDLTLFGVGCVIWTVLLVLVSYLCLRRRQNDLIQIHKKIDNKNKTNTNNVNAMNEKLTDCSDAASSKALKFSPMTIREVDDDDEGVEERSDEDVDETDDSESLPPLIDNEEIILEAKSNGERDPFEYCEHIQGEVKRIQQKITQKKFMKELTSTQLDEEREVQRKQLEAIFKLMAEKEDKFGVNSFDEIQGQMKMYI